MTAPIGGLSGLSGFDRVLKKIMEVTERFEAVQGHVKDIQDAMNSSRKDANTFRSALTQAQERQSKDGKTKYPETGTAAEKSARAGAAPEATGMEKRLMETLRRELPKYDVPPDLALAVMKAESNFNPGAVSPKGAIGIMQLMPSTAAGLGVDDEKDLFEPEVNIPTGLQYLSNLLAKYSGNEKLALAAYNAGPGAVDRHGGVPPYAETQDYIRKVTDIRTSLSEGSLE